MNRKKIILSGGGTGGHIFPAVSIAGKLREKLDGADILFVGAKGKMEMDKVPQAGYPIIGLPVSGFHRRLTIKNITFLFKLLASLLKASKIIREFRPDLVIGTGGFASGPIVKAASRKGIPCLLQEQNAFPGVTNRILAKRVNTICVAHEGLESYFPKEKIVLTGNPVREDIINNKYSREEAIDHFGIKVDKPTVLVFGGSLGARTINNAISNHLEHFAEMGVNLIWQTGKDFFASARNSVDRTGVENIKVRDFIYRMDLAYKVADIIISRAGAISISELCLVGKPVILVPYPHAAGDHQVKNAKSLEEKRAAIVVYDKDADKDLLSMLKMLLHSPGEMKLLGANIAALGKPDATLSIVGEAIKLLGEIE